MVDRLYIPAVGYATVFIRLLGVVQFLVNLISCLTFLLIWLGTRCELTLSLSILLICIWQRRWRCLHCSSAMQNSFPLSFNYTVIVLGEASSPSAFHQIAIIYESNICQVSQQIHCILQKLISFL